MPQQLFDTYGRGILQRPHPRRVPAAYVRQALNCVWPGGLRRQRPAVRPYQGLKFTDAIIGAGLHVAANGRRDILVITAGTPGTYRLAAYGDPVALTLDALPTTLRTRQTTPRAYMLSLSGGANLTFLYDGVNTNLKYDGTKLTKMGISAAPPPRVPALATLGGAISNGVRKYVATLDSGFHEGNPTPFTSALSVTFAGNTRTQVATFPALRQGAGFEFDDPQVTTWGLWRTVDDGEDYFLIDKAPVGTDILDTVSDDVLTTGRPLIEFVGAEPPGPFIALVEHRGQLLGVATTDRNMVHHSYFDPEYMAPEGWPQNWQTPIAHGDGDKITALASFHEYALVWKEHALYRLIGAWPDMDPQPVYVAGTRGSIGCPAQGAVRQLENTILFASRDGVYAVRRATGADAGVAAVRVSGAIDDLWGATDFVSVAGTLYDRKRRTAVVLAKGRAP